MKKGFKSGFVALIGRPNVGKSTLMNRLIGQKIAITSKKPQTTRNRIQTVYTDEEKQVIFLDTPGIHKSKNKLGEFMVNTAEHTIDDADAVLWLVEPTEYSGAGEQHIAELLSGKKTPVILVVNKVDTVKKEELAAVVAKYASLMDFDEIVPVSALTGKNTDTLMDVIAKYLPEGPMYYDEDTLTDQPEKAIAAEIIREKALRLLGEEVPHGIAVLIDSMKERPDGRLIDINATIYCERDSHKGIIIGKQGAKLKQIGTEARGGIEALTGLKVNLKLWVKVKKDWRDSDVLIKNFGYSDNNG
ncbi:MAG: GTPase Era [Clostridia bacterium]|nr:GTPase Era [Clostridia bacterium]